MNPQIGKQYENPDVMTETLVSQPKSRLNHENWWFFYLKKKRKERKIEKNTESHGFFFKSFGF